LPRACAYPAGMSCVPKIIMQPPWRPCGAFSLRTAGRLAAGLYLADGGRPDPISLPFTVKLFCYTCFECQCFRAQQRDTPPWPNLRPPFHGCAHANDPIEFCKDDVNTCSSLISAFPYLNSKKVNMYTEKCIAGLPYLRFTSFSLLLIFSCQVFFIADVAPATDIPAHLALVRALLSMGSGDILDQHFTFGFFPAPNSLTYILGISLSCLFKIHTVGVILFVASIAVVLYGLSS